nr:O-antigen ligase family protein [uncultured Fluviicola sp.]
MNNSKSYLAENRPWWIELLIVFCLLSPGYYFGNEYIILALPIITLLYDQSFWKKAFSDLKEQNWSSSALRYFWLPCLFVLLSLLNKLVNGHELRNPRDFYASFMLLPFLLIAARGIFSKRIIKLVVIFVLLETLIGLLEYLYHVRSFFVPLNKESLIVKVSSIYNTRVFGLGSNSPVFGLRCLVALFFLEATDWKRYWKWLFKIVLILGVIVSFNRSVVISCVVFYVLQLLQLIWHHRHSLKQLIRNKIVHDSLATCILLAFIFGSNYMMKGMNREGVPREDMMTGKQNSGDCVDLDFTAENKDVKLPVLLSDSELYRDYPRLKELDELDSLGAISQKFLSLTKSVQSSGRKLIWLNYLQFIEKNPLTGNGSEKLYFTAPDKENKKTDLIHAHNSFLELLGTNGLFLGLMYLVMIVLWWRRKNFPILAAIIIYSLMQYGIFWGMSFLDVIFVFLVISDANIIDFGGKSSRT